MKKLLYIVAVMLLVCSCAKSDKAKINALIKSDLSQTMHDFKSYEPVATDIDSVFDAAYLNKRAWNLSEQIISNINQLEDIDSELESMKFEMQMAGISGDRSRLKQLSDDMDSQLANMKRLIDDNERLSGEIRSINEAAGHKFVGYYCTHKFRCNNAMGNKIIATASFYITADCSQIVAHIFDEDGENIEAHITAAIKEE